MSVLSTSGINSLVSSYISAETQRRLDPLTTKKSKYQSLSSAYGTLSSKLSTLKSTLTTLKLTGSESAFLTKKASSSDSSFVSAIATSSAANSSFSLRVSQLAKSDVALSSDLASASINGVTTGAHAFTIKTGDGETGEFLSNISVDLDATDTNKETMEKIRNAINADRAVVTSNSMSGTYSGAAGKFTVDVDGTEHEITYNSGESYDSIITNLVEQINEISGVTAEKVIDGSNVSLKITVTDSSKYISIENSTDTGDLLDSSHFNIDVTKEKGASGIVSASVFSPTTTTSQFSLTAKNSGLDYRIKSLLDAGTSTALDSIGMNLGSSRPTFSQVDGADTAGFVYSDITDSSNQLNAKIQFNGLTIQRNSNAVSDLVTGVTFNLQSVMNAADKDVSVSIQNNIDESKTQIQKFIDNFNAAYSYLRTQSSNTNGTRGVFYGDSNAMSLKNLFTTYGYTQVSGLSADSVKSLTEIGITFDVNVGLKVSDNSLLEDKLTNNIDEVEALFNSTDGIANSLYNSINPYLGSAGYISTTQTSLNNNVRNISSRISTINTSINKSADTLRKRYDQLLSQLAELYSSQSYLSSLSG
ncbi:MAG: flagellar filament capping protein FliD [bacterium]